MLDRFKFYGSLFIHKRKTKSIIDINKETSGFYENYKFFYEKSKDPYNLTSLA